MWRGIESTIDVPGDRVRASRLISNSSAAFPSAGGDHRLLFMREAAMLADARRQFLEDYGRIRSAEGRGSDGRAVLPGAALR